MLRIEEWGLSDGEARVLAAVDYMAPVFEGALLRAIEEDTGWPYGGETLSLDEARHSFDGCLARRLVKEISASDCALDAKRWALTDDEACSDIPYRAGSLDFTQAGAALWFAIQSWVAMSSGKRPFEDSYFSRIDAYGDVHVFADSVESVREGVDCVRQGVAPDLQISVDGPYEIGTWWISRFICLPLGFRADIRGLEAETGRHRR